jgi:hypothetical protein
LFNFRGQDAPKQCNKDDSTDTTDTTDTTTIIAPITPITATIVVTTTGSTNAPNSTTNECFILFPSILTMLASLLLVGFE